MCLQIWDSSVVLQVSLITSHVLSAVQFSKERSWGLQIQLKNVSDTTDPSHIPVYSKSVFIVHFLSFLRLSSSAGFSGCRAMRRTMQLGSPATSLAVTGVVRLEERGYPIPAGQSQSSDRARVICAEHMVGRDPTLCCIQQRWGQEDQCDSLLGYPPSISFLPHVNWLFCHCTLQAWLRQKHLLYHVSLDRPRLQSVVGEGVLDVVATSKAFLRCSLKHPWLWCHVWIITHKHNTPQEDQMPHSQHYSGWCAMPRRGGGKQQVTLFENVSKAGLLDWPRLPKEVLLTHMDTSYSPSGKLKLLLGINTDRTWSCSSSGKWTGTNKACVAWSVLI